MPALIGVLLGGAIGTGLRLALDTALPHGDADFPWSTLAINILGALALGWLVGGLWTRPSVPHWVKAGIGPGLLGSFTTFSAVMVSLVAQTSAGLFWLAAGYAGVSIVLGFGAAALGLWAGSHIAHRPLPSEITDEGSTL
ncbi:fluoride efflux transporter FluC [Luethyella okanaganae]|uniref:Fluoride-specific ion channel FluC n=1 Tax=Luethyella okanaganae TaxID=69372 RepID=A0ABW1VEY1_9MICO